MSISFQEREPDRAGSRKIEPFRLAPDEVYSPVGQDAFDEIVFLKGEIEAWRHGMNPKLNYGDSVSKMLFNASRLSLERALISGAVDRTQIRRILDWGSGVIDTIDYERALENTGVIDNGKYLQMLEAAKRDPSLSIFYEDESLMPKPILKQLKQSQGYWSTILSKHLPAYKEANYRAPVSSSAEIELNERFESIINAPIAENVPQEETV